MTRTTALALAAALGLTWILLALGGSSRSGVAATPLAGPAGIGPTATLPPPPPPPPLSRSSQGAANPVAGKSSALPPTENARAWGRITGPQGEPLPGATISLRRFEPEEAEDPPGDELTPEEQAGLRLPGAFGLEVEVVAETRSDAAGGFELTLPPARARELRWFQIEHPEHVLLVSAYFQSFAGEFEVALPLGATLEVQLVGQGGVSVSEPTIEIWVDAPALAPIRARGLEFRPAEVPPQGQDRWATRSAESSPRVFRGLPAGEVEVRARARGHRLARQTLTLGSGEARQLEVRLDPGLRLSGTVRTPEGEPIAGALVTLHPERGPSPRSCALEVRAGASGGFLLQTGLEPDADWVKAQVEAKGYRRGDWRLHSGQTHLAVVLEPDLKVAGRVIPTPPGGVLDGCFVSLVSAEGRSVGNAIRGDGGFVIHSVARGRYTLLALGPGVVTPLPLEISVTDHDLSGLELRLEAGRSAVFRVSDARGTPLSGASVEERLRLPFEQPRPLKKLETGPAGRAVITGLAPGEREFAIGKPGYVEAKVSLLVSGEGDREPVEVILERAGELLASVLDPQGRALPDLWIRFEHQGDRRAKSCQIRTDSSGRAGPQTISPGTYRISAKVGAIPYSFGELSIAPGEQLETTLTARPLGGGVITGVVIQGGSAAAESLVWLREESSHLSLWARTSREGAFAFTGLPAGAFTVTTTGGSPVLARLTTPDESLHVQLRLWEGSVAGTVLLPSGDPLPVENTRVVICSGAERRAAKTDSGGRFRFRNVNAGRYVIACRTRYGVARSEFTLQPLQALDGVRVQLAAGADLELEVLRGDGSPAAGVEVNALHVDLGLYATGDAALDPLMFPTHRTSARGGLRLDHLLPGPYTLYATSAGGEVGAVARLELSAGGAPTRAQLRLALPAALRVFAAPATGFELRLGGELLGKVARGRLEAEAGSQGVLFEGLPAGEVEIRSLSSGGASVAPRRIKLIPGTTAEIDLR